MQQCIKLFDSYRKLCGYSGIMSPLKHCWQVQQRMPSLYRQVTCRIQWWSQGTFLGSSQQQWWNCEKYITNELPVKVVHGKLISSKSRLSCVIIILHIAFQRCTVAIKVTYKFTTFYLLYGRRKPTPAKTNAKYIQLHLSTGGERWLKPFVKRKSFAALALPSWI